MMRKLVIGIAVLALSVYGGASATTSAVSNDALDDQADGTRVGSPAKSTWSNPADTVVQVTVTPPAPAAAAPERVLSANPLWAMPLAQFPVTRERPIFSTSRRPPPAAVAPVSVPRVATLPKTKGARASAAYLGRHHRKRRGGVRDIPGSIDQGGAAAESRRGVSGLEAAIGAGPGSGAGKGSAGRHPSLAAAGRGTGDQ